MNRTRYGVLLIQLCIKMGVTERGGTQCDKDYRETRTLRFYFGESKNRFALGNQRKINNIMGTKPRDIVGGGCSMSSILGVALVLLVFVSVTSAQITFSRQWVRGKYPGDDGAGESPEFQRAVKAVLPKRTFTRYSKPPSSDYVPILVNAHLLEELFDRYKEPSIPGTSSLSMENAKK